MRRSLLFDSNHREENLSSINIKPDGILRYASKGNNVIFYLFIKGCIFDTTSFLRHLNPYPLETIEQ